MIEEKRKSLIHNSLGGQWKGNEIGIKSISFSLIISLAVKILKLNSCLYPTIHRI